MRGSLREREIISRKTSSYIRQVFPRYIYLYEKVNSIYLYEKVNSIYLYEKVNSIYLYMRKLIVYISI